MRNDKIEDKDGSYYEASFSGGFMESFMTLNIINFVDMARREKDGVSWDVRGVSSS